MNWTRSLVLVGLLSGALALRRGLIAVLVAVDEFDRDAYDVFDDED